MARIIIQGARAAKAEMIEQPETESRIMRCACGDEAVLSNYGRADALEECERHVDYVCRFRFPQAYPDVTPNLYDQGVR